MTTLKTIVSRGSKQVTIGGDGPTILIGERINPTGKKKLAETLKSGDLSMVKELAIAQTNDGAGILDVNVVTPGVDEVAMLPRAVEAVMAVSDLPICIDVNDSAALRGALKVYDGKPIINSVTGEEKSLEEVLPLVKEYGAVVIGLTIDESGIPKEAGKRVEIAHKIVERANAMGIPTEDVIIDTLCLTVGSDSKAGKVTLNAIARVNAELKVNQTLGASNISFGLPNRQLANSIFLAMAIQNGLTCPCVNPTHATPTALAADLMLARDNFAMRYMKAIKK